eukprot:4570827-Pyramimonas_sp.AAC.1
MDTTSLAKPLQIIGLAPPCAAAQNIELVKGRPHGFQKNRGDTTYGNTLRGAVDSLSPSIARFMPQREFYLRPQSFAPPPCAEKRNISIP